MRDEGSFAAGDRRRVDRTPATGLDLTLVLSGQRSGFARLFRLRARQRRVTVDVLDLSLGGARIRLPGDVELSFGAIVRLEVDEAARARAVVRHSSTGTAGQVCGLQFTGLHNPSTSLFFQALMDQLEGLQLAWNQADETLSPNSNP